MSAGLARRVTAPVPTSGFLAVLGAAALFGMLGPLSRFAYDDGMEPAAFVAWRALIGAIGAAAFVAWRIRTGSSHLVRPSELPARVRVTLFVATCMGFFLNLLMFIAFDLVTVALALLCFYSYPAMVATVNVALGRDRLDATRSAALGLALLGMVAVVASQLDPTTGIRFDPVGVGVALGAALCQTVFIVISRDGYSTVPSEQAMTLVLVVTVVGATLLAILGGRAETLAFPLQTPSILPLLVFTGIFAAAIPSIAFLSGVRAVGGTRAGILMLFEPVVGVALAAWLLGERLVPIQVAGALAILAAAVILQRGTVRGEAATEPWPVVG